MKIAFADNQQLRFDRDLYNYWSSLHEVKYEMGFSEHLAAWADVYYINYWDNNIHAAYHWYQDHPEWKKPKFIVRAIDWEVWSGLARDQRIVDWVDEAICITPHIEEQLRKHANFGNKLHLIPCGIDTERFTLKQGLGTFNIVLPCNEIDWILKNVTEGIKIVGSLHRKHPEIPYVLYVKGKWTQGNEYFKVYFNDLVKKAGLEGRVSFIDQEFPDYNEFLENMDYCLVPSYKEAFSYVVGECAAKGIKPICNWWYGAEDIWPKEWLYTLPEDAVSMFTKDYDPEKLRRYITEHKNVKQMFAQYDQLLGV